MGRERRDGAEGARERSGRHEEFLREAIRIASESADAGGGPFGALVVRDGRILATGVNRVTSDLDPTAHAEIVAIREACRRLGTFQLPGCTVYASSEPCPMCLAAAYWVRPEAIYFAASREDAESAGFEDALIYRELSLPLADRRLNTQRLAVAGALEPFRRWLANPDRVEY